MRALSLMAAIGAAIAFGGSAAAPPIGGFSSDLMPARKQRKGKGQANRRGKGATARPQKRSNRLTISKRVRRKHRRSA